MRYSADLVEKILAELEKVPIVRHVCTKFDIDHSTFYRWMVRHATFHKQVLAALFLGRRKLGDAAESVIVSGIQNKDFRAATFWLVHNDPRYMTLDKGKHHQGLIENMLEIAGSTKRERDPASFESVFKIFACIEDGYDEKEEAQQMMGPIVDLLCFDDPKLVDVFYAAYANWKKSTADVAEKVQKAGTQMDEKDGIPPEETP